MGSWLRRARHLGALFVGTAIVTIWLVSIVFEDHRFCDEALATIGDDPVVEVCGPATFTDLLVGWAALGALLLPDVKELSAGGVTIKFGKRE